MGGEFWLTCARLLRVYPQRPATLRGDAEPKQLLDQLRSLARQWLADSALGSTWLVEGSVGKGTWAAIPWLAFLDPRESRGPQYGSYPCLHFSADSPVGLRIGWGVSVTEYQGRTDERAQAIHAQLSDSETAALVAAGFLDVVATANQSDKARVLIGGSNLARKYGQGMLFERFVTLEELEAVATAADTAELGAGELDTTKSGAAELDSALTLLLTTYQAWVERTPRTMPPSQSGSFLDLMRVYANEKVVFQSPKRDARYFISEVDHTGCTVERLDSNKAERVTELGYHSRRDWLREQGGTALREALDNTVARHMCYLQAADLCLAADRRSARFLPDLETATQELIQLLRSMQTITLYKPVIVMLVIEAIRDGELTENRIEFDGLLERFIARLKTYGQDVGEQQLAEGFVRMAADVFWLLAYHDPHDRLSSDKPTPAQIRRKISHARIHEAFWLALQDAEVQERVLAALREKWWPTMSEPMSSELDGDLATAVESLIEAIADDGFVYQPWQIATYVSALRTKPLVILAGVSGTGKSKLPKLVAQFTGGSMERIAVRPDWTDSSEVLGYADIQDRFRPGVFLQTAAAATAQPGDYYVALIDEMNLARVEHYFAEVLSAIEDRRPATGGGFMSGPLFSQHSRETYGEWASQCLPENLGVVGTVNMDDSAHGFSRKVLDRAFTIELSEVDLSFAATPRPGAAAKPIQKWPRRFWQGAASRLAELDQQSASYHAQAERATNLLEQINDCLMRSQLQVGYRTRDEVILFLIHADEVVESFRTREGDKVDPLDVAILMKVLPRIVGGSQALRATLIGLMGLASQGQPLRSDEEADDLVAEWSKARRADSMEGRRLPRTCARLCLMWDRLQSEGYTAFWI